MPLARALAALPVALAVAWPAAPARAAGNWTWPVDGPVVTAFRNGSDPYARGQHRGIDIAAPAGTPVRAAAAGTVRFAGTAGSSGLLVSIRTGAFDTSYLHLGAAAVRAGDRVGPGDRVGSVGTSGRRSAVQPHLHFGVRDAGERHAYRDPLDFLTPLVPRAAPRGAPAPLGVPVRARPLAEPARGRRPVPARRRVRVPDRPRVPLPAGRRVPVPNFARTPRALPAPRSVPAPAARRAPLPRVGPAAAPAPEPRPLPAPARHGEPAHAGGAASGPDLGLLLACLGLLVAATCLGLGRSGDGRPRTGRGRAALRALTGR